MYIICAIMVIAAIAIIPLALSDSKKKKEARAGLERTWPGSTIYQSSDGVYVAIDPVNEKIVVSSPSISTNFRGAFESVYTFGQIVAVEKHVNGGAVSRTNRGSQAVGAAVGALALGGVGAIIGGLSASSNSTNTVNKISVKIFVDDRERPFHEILFFNNPKGAKENGFLIGMINQNADEFHGRLLAAMHKSSQSDRLTSEDSRLPENLKQLWELKQAGAITEDEFANLKKGFLDKR